MTTTPDTTAGAAGQLISYLATCLSGDHAWDLALSRLACAEAGLHLAVLVEPFCSLLLDGTKTIESRFSRVRCAPCETLAEGDVVVVKKSGGPVTGAFQAGPRLINFAIMREIADEVGATLMADMAHFAGLVAGGVLTGDFSPVGHAQIITTTTHKSLRGPRGGMVLCEQELAEYVARGCPMVLGGPLPHVMAAKAVALAEARRPEFAGYARRIVENAAALADGLLRRDITLVTGGTDNHLVLMDVSGYGLTGRQAEAPWWTPVSSPTATASRDPNGAWHTPRPSPGRNVETGAARRRIS